MEVGTSLNSQKETPTNNLNIELTKKNGEKMSVSGDIPHESLNLILRSFFETDHMKVMI